MVPDFSMGTVRAAEKDSLCAWATTPGTPEKRRQLSGIHCGHFQIPECHISAKHKPKYQPRVSQTEKINTYPVHLWDLWQTRAAVRKGTIRSQQSVFRMCRNLHWSARTLRPAPAEVNNTNRVFFLRNHQTQTIRPKNTWNLSRPSIAPANPDNGPPTVQCMMGRYRTVRRMWQSADVA